MGTGSKPTEFRSFDPLGFLRFVHKRPGNAVSPSGLLPFSAVSRNAFRPEEPRNGPEPCFFFKDPIFIWEKGTLGALSLPGASLLLGEVQEVVLPFGPPGARKTPEMAHFGRKSVFPCRRSRVDGAGGTKVPFRCNS